MAPRLEYEGKSLKKAVEKACKKLKIDPEQIKYEVISHGSSGIFGLARVKKAKIRVLLASEKEPVKSFPPEAEIVKDAFHLDDSPDDDFPEDIIQLGRNVLERILEKISKESQITVKQNGSTLMFQIKGENAGMIIGKKGQTLEAIQLLVEKIINKKNKKRVRIQVDVEGYLEKRKNNLKKTAKRLANKANKIGKPVSLGEMNAMDRRTVHLALKNDPSVQTRSTGDGYIKKLMIFPKKSKKQHQRKGAG
jgi:spoIIIJ-associated protein